MNASSTMQHPLRSNKGQTLAELALIIPLMLALVFGAIEIGSIISTYLTISHTAREGANLTSRGTRPTTALRKHLAEEGRLTCIQSNVKSPIRGTSAEPASSVHKVRLSQFPEFRMLPRLKPFTRSKSITTTRLTY
jgi:Flp pilus assembly protein TadG